MIDLLNLNNDDFSGKSQARKVDENLYNPGPDQAQNGIYKAVVRFLPYAKDKALSKYKKYTAKLVNPLTNEKMYIDCPSTNGVSSILWSLDKEIKNLEKTEPTVHEELKKYFSRSYNYYSPAYIKKDPQFPAMEGKIKIIPFGYTIDNLIQQQLNPEADLLGVQKINPYHLIDGKDFIFVVKRKTKTWRDFSSCQFINQVSPLIVNIDGQEIPMTTDSARVSQISNFILENTPDMTPYLFKPWTDADYEKVAQFVKAIVPYKQVLENVLADCRDEKIKKFFTNNSAPINRSQNHGGEALEFGIESAPKNEAKPSQLDLGDDDFMKMTSSEPAKSTSKKSNNAPADDEMADLLADL